MAASRVLVQEVTAKSQASGTLDSYVNEQAGGASGGERLE